MRHLIVATTMLVIALVITFATASLLQVMAVAQSNRPSSSVVVEVAKPPLKPVAGKERMLHEGFVRTAAIAGL